MPTPGFKSFPRPTRKDRKRLARDRFAGFPQAKRMRIIDPAAIEAARKTHCEICGCYFPRSMLQVHHVIARGMGGAKGDDVRENLITACTGPGTNDCHGRSDRHELGYTVPELQAIVARRTT